MQPRINELVNQLALFDRAGLTHLQETYTDAGALLKPGIMMGTAPSHGWEIPMYKKLAETSLNSSKQTLDKCIQKAQKKLSTIHHINYGSRIAALVGGITGISLAATTQPVEAQQHAQALTPTLGPICAGLVAFLGGLVPIVTEMQLRGPYTDRDVNTIYREIVSIDQSLDQVKLALSAPISATDKEYLEKVLNDANELVGQTNRISLELGIVKKSVLENIGE